MIKVLKIIFVQAHANNFKNVNRLFSINIKVLYCKLTQQKIERLNRHKTKEEIEKVVKDLLLNKVSHNFMHEFFQTFKKQIIHELSKLPQSMKLELVLPNSFHKITVAQIP